MMLKIFPILKVKIILMLTLFSTLNNANAMMGDRIADGRVEIKSQGNNICFSISKYNGRPALFRRYKVDQSNLKLSYISISGDKEERAWGASVFGEQFKKYAIPIKSNNCLEFGKDIAGYTPLKNKTPLVTDIYSVALWAYDVDQSKTIKFFTVFDLVVSDGKMSVTKIY